MFQKASIWSHWIRFKWRVNPIKDNIFSRAVQFREDYLKLPIQAEKTILSLLINIQIFHKKAEGV